MNKKPTKPTRKKPLVGHKPARKGPCCCSKAKKAAKAAKADISTTFATASQQELVDAILAQNPSLPEEAVKDIVEFLFDVYLQGYEDGVAESIRVSLTNILQQSAD